MLDIKFIRENPDAVRQDLEKRKDKEKLGWLDDLLKKDEQYRKLQQEVEKLRHRRNEVSKEINRLKKEDKDASKTIKEAKEIPEKIKKAEEKTEKLRKKILFYQMRLPNILHESVPYGKDEEENVTVKKWGKITKPTFKLLPHGELIEKLDIGDFKRAAKIAGNGFYYLIGELALMDMALQRFAIDLLVKKGYTPVIPPYMMRREAYEGVTDLADFETMMYKVQDEDLYLIATSEHPMGAMFKDEIMEPSELPVKFCGISPCFRKEIGSAGVDTKGIFRVHQFTKVEQFIFCRPEESWKFHEELLKNAEEIFQALKVPYRVINICTGDIGIVAAKKYDLEVWMPREEKYRELVSCSNCTAYQAARLNIRYRAPEGSRFVHTLNSTATATSRTLRAILENYQNPDGTVTVPKVLVPYMNTDKIFRKKH
ncbi:serine--tRNA ligase [Candidatus Woesearchaeota archaeon]|nr:serine--tRNA ligase [Candidatus Woesearchaeota archaeon]